MNRNMFSCANILRT